MGKRTAQIVAHVSPETASMFRAMAELEETSCSEKAGDLITEYLESKQSQYEAMRKVFESEQNCK